MIVSICGTPGTGKTTVAEELRRQGREVIDLGVELRRAGLFEEDMVTGELEVDLEKAREHLEDLSNRTGGDILIDGHLSYLAPWNLCLVLRLHPRELKGILVERGYSDEKVKDNFEAEIVGSVLVDAMDEKESRGMGTLLELDRTGMGPSDLAMILIGMMKDLDEKKLNELQRYLPGKVDWLEVSGEWY